MPSSVCTCQEGAAGARDGKGSVAPSKRGSALHRGNSVQRSRSKGLAGITVAALTAAAFAAGPAAAADTFIYSCIDKKTGDARLVTKAGAPLTSSTVCDPNEYAT